MEQKLQNRYGRWGRALCFALALALAALLSLTALPLTGVYADETAPSMPRTPLDWEQDATLQLKLPEDLVTDEADRASLEEDLQVDLYKIAGAVQVDGYDIYAFVLNDQLPTEVQDGIRTFLEGQDSWVVDTTGGVTTFRYVPDRSSGMILDDGSMAELSKLAAELIFANDNTYTEVNAALFGTEHPVDFGLYLAMPHSSSLTKDQYQVKVPIKDQSYGYNPATLAIAPNHSYTFAPQLISVPSLGGLIAGAAADTAADAPTAWDYTVEAVAKPEEQPRYASLSLSKTLNSFNGPANFVFEITAVQNGEIVFEKQAAFNFTQTGTQTVQVDGRIPAGSTVTVEELYSGATYSFKAYEVTNAPWSTNGDKLVIESIPAGNVVVAPWDEDDRTADRMTIEAGVVVAANATNEPNNSSNNGNGVVNRFDKRTGGTDWYGWNWTQDFVVPLPTNTPQQ